MSQPGELSRAVARALETVLRRPRPRLAAEEVERISRALLRCGAGQRALFLRNASRAREVSVVQRLLAECRVAADRGPKAALETAETAAAAAEALTAESGLGPLRQDLRAEASGLLANAHRLAGCHEQAERAWDLAWQLTALGSGDPLLPAWLAQEEASLRLDQGRFASARCLLERSAAAYELVGEEEALERVLGRLDLVAPCGQGRFWPARRAGHSDLPRPSSAGLRS